MSSISHYAPDYCDCPKCAAINERKTVVVATASRVAYQINLSDRDLASCCVEVMLATIAGACTTEEEFMGWVEKYYQNYIKEFAKNASEYLITKNNDYRANKEKIDAEMKERMKPGGNTDGVDVRVRIIDEETGQEFKSTAKH